MQTVHPRSAGASLVDVMFAISLVAFASAALFLLYSNALRLLQSQQETEAATLCLQDRAEQLRAANWDVLTGATALAALVRTAPANGALLPSYSETVTVAGWPVTTAKKLVVTRATTGAVTTVSQNTALVSATALRVDLRATWLTRGRTHIRENSLVLAQGGVVP